MSKSIVLYYSKTGSNRYLAEKTAETLGAHLKTLKPRLTPFPFQLIASATGISPGNRKLKVRIEEYDTVILCGPIWMGCLIAPLRDFLKKYGNKIGKLHFMTCCGSTDGTKEDKFGYSHVFRKVEAIMEGNAGHFRAFPIELVLEDSRKTDDQAIMSTRLSDSNFKGAIEERFYDFIEEISR